MTFTCVSCYFPVKNKYDINKDDNKYIEWFKNTLSINCPYVFFTTKEYIDVIKSYRKNYPTYFIECNIEDFYTYKYKEKMITDPIHCPSVELNLLWNEKMFMIKKAYDINPFNSEWFQWIDAGICIYRDKTPRQSEYPHMKVFVTENLPKNKIIVEPSFYYYNPDLVRNDNYYHYISGTSYILHNSIINNFVNIYVDYLDKLVDENNIWTDQVILTHIYKDLPHLFCLMTVRNSYGHMVEKLYY